MDLLFNVASPTPIRPLDGDGKLTGAGIGSMAAL
jgi:hypothetical protein